LGRRGWLGLTPDFQLLPFAGLRGEYSFGSNVTVSMARLWQRVATCSWIDPSVGSV